MSENRQLRELEVAAATGRRSPLFLWMYRHHADFAALVKRVGRPNWSVLATKFAQMDLTDRHGRGPTPEGARQTWVKVRKALEREAMEDSRLPQSAAQPRDGFWSNPPMDEAQDLMDIDRALGIKPK